MESNGIDRIELKKSQRTRAVDFFESSNSSGSEDDKDNEHEIQSNQPKKKKKTKKHTKEKINLQLHNILLSSDQIEQFSEKANIKSTPS